MKFVPSPQEVTQAELDAKISDTAANDAAIIHAGTSKVVISDNDEIGMADSAASYVFKKGLFSSIKSTLKTYFDTLYATLGSGFTNNAIAGVVPVSDGINLVGSTITDNGSVVNIAAKTAISSSGASADFGTDDQNTIILGVGQTYQLRINNTDNNINLQGTKILMADLPTSDPLISGQIYSNLRVLMVSNG